MDDQQIRELVHRVVGRTLAERGIERAAFEQTCVPSRRTSGVHVAVHPAGHPSRPAENSTEALPSRGRPLVTVACLDEVEDGTQFQISSDAMVTTLARDEAARRHILLCTRSTLTGDGSRLRVALGADHGGFALKRRVLEWVRELGHHVVDLGTHDESPVDYPDFAAAVARAVANERVDLGICIDSSGTGSAIAANKIAGVRAAVCCDAAMARSAREHNHANVLALGGKTLSPSIAAEIVKVFLSTPVAMDRHARRVEKLMALESGRGPFPSSVA